MLVLKIFLFMVSFIFGNLIIKILYIYIKNKKYNRLWEIVK